jgi:hypothetical protein
MRNGRGLAFSLEADRSNGPFTEVRGVVVIDKKPVRVMAVVFEQNYDHEDRDAA